MWPKSEEKLNFGGGWIWVDELNLLPKKLDGDAPGRDALPQSENQRGTSPQK